MLTSTFRYDTVEVEKAFIEYSNRLGRFTVFFRFYFQTGFFGLAFTKTEKPSLRNCLLSSPETRS
jgi:hypothetical protein